MKKVSKTARSIMKAMDASTPHGIRFRTRFAIICALVFIAIDTIFVTYNYKYIPNTVPILHDVNGVLVEERQKSVFFEYELERILMLIGTAIVAWLIKSRFKSIITYARTRCFLFDVVNLFITSLTGISMIELAIAKGEDPGTLSYFEEFMIFLFWFIVMLGEYINDVRKIRKYLKKK
ncbi:MAG: hypothetical protein Q4F34_01410 [Prevotellaceae bacterium]|nr:hypothetical protein [Prevotellaceae bacterium]